MFKKTIKRRTTFMLFSITVFLILYNVFRKNSIQEFGQPLVRLQPLKTVENLNPNEVASQEGGDEAEDAAAEENEDENLRQDFGIDGDVKAAVDNLGTNKKKQVISVKTAADDVENGGEFYND